MKIAAVFSGQGSQYAGMGKTLYESSEIARGIYAKASDILGYDTADISFNGTEAELSLTKYSQGAIFTHSLAAFMTASVVLPGLSAVCGHSLGEFAALAAAGVYSIEDGFKIIKLRSELMHEYSKNADGMMAAIIGPSSETAGEVLAEFEGVYLVNYNTEKQNIISGCKTAVEAASKSFEALKARVMPLGVSGAFHTVFMKDAAEIFKKELSKFTFNAPKIPFYSNLTGTMLAAGDYPDYFYNHMINPVLFTKECTAMQSDGIDTFVEFGPKKTVSSLIKKNLKGANVYNIDDFEDIEKVKQSISGKG